MSIQYAGGTNVNATFTSDGTKGNLQSNVIANLLTAGWVQATGPATGGSLTFTITIASPGVVTYATHGLVAGDSFTPSTSGALPTGLTAGTRYFVKTVLSSSTFTLAATSGGTVIATTGSQSGTHTAIMSVRMATATTAWSVFARVHILDVGSNSLNFGLENSTGSVVGSISTVNGAYLFPLNLRVYRIVANKYQFFIFAAATTPVKAFVAAGTPYMPSFLQGVQTECGWLMANVFSDSDVGVRSTFRTLLQAGGTNIHAISNANLLESANTATAPPGAIVLAKNVFSLGFGTGETGVHWHDSSAIMIEPLIAWATSSLTLEPLIRGQLWDAVIVQDTFAADTTSAFDSRNWICLTDNNTTEKASLLLVVP